MKAVKECRDCFIAQAKEAARLAGCGGGDVGGAAAGEKDRSAEDSNRLGTIVGFVEPQTSKVDRKRYVLLGVGNEFNGDDAVGPFVAQNFRHTDWAVYDCSTVPENFIAPVERHAPELLVIVDAAEMGLPAGEIRIVPKEKIRVMTMSTHSLPLSLFMDHLEGAAEKMLLIGIQPASTEDFSPMCKAVEGGALKLLEIIEKKDFDTLEELS
ncbi:MAG: hypothetical protein CVT48_06515 [Thermoplasmata archaeon HGW-Thermoplasmata-1]|nr:MAG: hypothetical protein CVT48_06515 [Thermoplasmata archaeon HGW-Thermoplasmata-1]